MATPHQLYAEAVAHFKAGRSAEAEALCQKLAKLQPANADVHNLLGLALRRRGKHDEALASFKRALELNAKLAPVHLNCGLTLFDLGHVEEAEHSFRQALACDPQSTPARFHLGVALHQRARFEEAIACFQHVIVKEPRHVNTHALMGLGFLLLGRLTEAKTSLETAAALNPDLANVHDGLGIVAEDEGRFDDAIAHFQHALSINPDFTPAQFNRAVALLRRGDLARGLPAFESRWRLPRDASAAKMRDFSYPLWTGEHLKGKTLLIWGEQGIGDEIRDAGVVDDLLQRGDRIILECDPRLVSLYARSLPLACIVARQDPPAAEIAAANVTWQCPAETLARHVRPTLESFPQRPKYLLADAVHGASYRAQLSAYKSKRVVGISWSSQNAQFTRGKTIDLAAWAPLLKVPDCIFVDLQYGDTQTERTAAINNLGVDLVHLPDLDLTANIDGLAALMTACDLVITVSNSTAHLAGALGVPTWVLLPFGHFQPWYWFSERTDSPWYPSVQLYRQATFGDWGNVLARVREDLVGWQLKPVPTSP